MKKSILSILFIMLFLVSTDYAKTWKSTDSQNKPSREYMPGQVIVKFSEKVGNITSQSVPGLLNNVQVYKVEQLSKNVKFKSTVKKSVIDLSRIYLMEISREHDIIQLCNTLMLRPDIEYAQPNYIVRAHKVPNDSLYRKQQHLPQIFMPKAWDIAQGDSNVVIGIIDTGVDYLHPDLAENMWSNKNEVLDGTDTDGNGFEDDIRGWDWVDGASNAAEGEDGDVQDNDPMDGEGHGTSVAGAAAAVTNNDIGIASVSWNCSIMPLRIGYLDSTSGSGTSLSDWIYRAILYATDNGADVINISFGPLGQLEADAARYAFDNDVVVCTSAGNDESERVDPFQMEPYTMSVAAVTSQDEKTTYSSYSKWISVSAPGGNAGNGYEPAIYTTELDSGYTWVNGTSISSPLVAGLAGLIKSYNPNWNATDIMMQIVETADNIDDINPQYAGKLGSGRINAYRALTETVSPKPKLFLTKVQIRDTVNGNDDGKLDPGETIDLIFEFENQWADATNLTASIQIDDYAIEVQKANVNLPDLAGLRNLDANKTDNSQDPFTLSVHPNALPHRITGTVQVAAAEGYSETFDFHLGIGTNILLVDDDHRGGDGTDNDVEDYYMSALDELGFSYDFWDHEISGTPENMANYSTVIWFCEWAFPSLDNDDRTELQKYLDNGGRFFLSGQDIGWDMNADVPPEQENEFLRSNGASKTFFEQYLHARFLKDDSDFSSLTGVEDDPIGHGLSFDVYQPGRASDNQYPDEIEPINGGIPIFAYPNGNAGAVRYAGDYRTVYFSFGGYEAIVQEEVRLKVLPRIINWLNNVQIVHDPLKDTENTENDYLVTVDIIANENEMKSVELYWDVDNEMPFNKVVMEKNTEGKYTATIPAQSDTTVQYTIFAQTTTGFYPSLEFYSFTVGKDTEPPVVTDVKGFSNTLDKKGPYHINVKVDDNLGIDTGSVYLHYAKYGMSEDSLKLVYDETKGVFTSILTKTYNYGDSLYYYITGQDLAETPNLMASPVRTIHIGWEDFESGLEFWKADPMSWGLTDEYSKSGEYSVNDSPGRDMVPGSEVTLSMKHGLDLSNSPSAVLRVWDRHFFRRSGDYGYIELSYDKGESWQQLGETRSGNKTKFIESEYSLKHFCGEGFDDVRIRFRAVADSIGNKKPGWYIDDVRVIEGPQVSVETPVAEFMPTRFKLDQNYPNPFNPTTSIQYSVPKTDMVKLEIYNLLGQKIRTLIHGRKKEGIHTVQWNGIDDFGQPVASGVYIYRFTAEIANYTESKKLLLMK